MVHGPDVALEFHSIMNHYTENRFLIFNVRCKNYIPRGYRTKKNLKSSDLVRPTGRSVDPCLRFLASGFEIKLTMLQNSGSDIV